MKWVSVLPLLLLAVAPLSAVPQKKVKPAAARAVSAPKITHRAPPSRAAGGKNGHPVLANVRYVKGRRGQPARRVHVAPKPSYQTQPDSARYQEIQKALADRGYFKGETSGEWRDDSSDALRRFQTDQKIDSDGKINAHTLIGLGLGPKHNGTIGNTSLVPIVQPPPEPVSAPPATEEPAASDPLAQPPEQGGRA